MFLDAEESKDPIADKLAQVQYEVWEYVKAVKQNDDALRELSEADEKEQRDQEANYKAFNQMVLDQQKFIEQGLGVSISVEDQLRLIEEAWKKIQEKMS